MKNIVIKVVCLFILALFVAFVIVFGKADKVEAEDVISSSEEEKEVVEMVVTDSEKVGTDSEKVGTDLEEVVTEEVKATETKVIHIRSWIDGGSDGLGGVWYDIIAENDVYGKDGKILYKEGECVANVKSDANGDAYTDALPVSLYSVEIGSVPKGYEYVGCEHCNSKLVSLEGDDDFVTFWYKAEGDKVKERADVNGDGRINASDVLIVLQYAVGIRK